MVDARLPDLTSAGDLQDGDFFYVVQGSADRKASGAQLKAYAGGGGGGGSFTVNASVTPTSGGSQSDGAQLSSGLTPIVPPANDGDSLQLPVATAGSIAMLFCIGSQAHTPIVYAKDGTSDTINGASHSAGFDLYSVTGGAGPNQSMIYVFSCSTNGAWLTNALPD